MTHRSVATVSLIALLLPLVAAAADDPPSRTLFRDVAVLTMTDAGALQKASVLVEDDRIAAVSAGPLDAPAGTRIVDGAGRTLMPGLADMHVHYWSTQQGPAYIANGVTTVRNLWGSSSTFVLDEKAKAGTDMAPHVLTSGPLMDGPEPIWGEGSIQLTEPEQAVGAVESQRTTGYPAVKLYEGLTPAIYRAAVAAAKERELQVYTHVPGGMTVEEVIELEVDSIEHFDGVNDSVAAVPDGEDDGGYFTRWANADPARMQALARLSAKHGVWHSPTFAVIAKRYEYGAAADEFLARPEVAYFGPGVLGWWQQSIARMGPWNDEKRAAAANQTAFLKALYDAGAPLLIGTDTPNPLVLPGFAIHDELAAFVGAGIPVDEVLRMATAGAARFMNKEGDWGVVAVGARADLVLLDADPRAGLDTLKRPRGVMVNGHWYDRQAIEAELEALKARVAAQHAARASDDADED